jgi:hypothetical protein
MAPLELQQAPRQEQVFPKQEQVLPLLVLPLRPSYLQ